MPALRYTCAGTECSPDDSRRDIRRRAWALIGTIAEPTASVRGHCDGNTVVFHVVTCVPEGSGQFASHGHTLRLTLRPAATGRPSAAEEPFGETGAGLRRGWGVSPGRQQAIACALQGLVPGGGRLSPARLQAVTGALVARRDLWADLVVHDPDVRWYLPLHRSNSCDVWLLAWECGQDTDWHDHGGSSGSFAAAEGCLVEQYRAASGWRLSRRQVVAGRGVAFGPGHVHNVAHRGSGSATSIHAYSPPLLCQ